MFAFIVIKPNAGINTMLSYSYDS